MLFNSLEYLIFLPTVFILYWFVFNNNLKWQNVLLVIVSYVFYGWWDYRFLSLIVFSSIVDYTIGRSLESTKQEGKRKGLLILSLIVNLGLLGFFKYYNFFVESFINAFSTLGIHLEASTLNIILPVGISFYTFQTLSYTIDVYRKKLEPTKDIVSFFAFVSFFPQLVAGPIERATNLLPQFTRNREFDIVKAKDGLRQILWGLFKKVLVADNCALYVNEVFANYETLPASTLVMGVVLFAFQIYGDFSGYSDIAIGTGRLFGFSLMRNFAYPYFSRDIGEFWRRWHISLSTWFRDYLYIPLGGSRVTTKYKLLRNVMIIFLVSGFWHGANWTFVVWGAINAIYFIPLLLRGKNRSNLNTVAEGSLLPSFSEFFNILLTFTLVCFAWIFFRASSITEAFSYIGHLMSGWKGLVTIPKLSIAFIFVGILIVCDWIQRDKLHPLELNNVPFIGRMLIYYTLIGLILFFKPDEVIDFIYFQF